MPFDSRPVRLLGLSGSLRRNSCCMSILRTLQEALSSSAELANFPLNEIPLYDEDRDDETRPMPVAALKQAITAADGLVIVSLDYDHGISGTTAG